MTVEVTVGVVTHERSSLFEHMLEHLCLSVSACPYPVTVLVVNNSGPGENRVARDLLDRSGLSRFCSVRLLDSPENNISTGRNLIIDSCKTQHLAFIDDDEYPEAEWLTSLVNQQLEGLGSMVGGPIVPVYPPEAPAWVREIDLHNTRGLSTGDVIRRTATGNCLLDLTAVGEIRFDHAFGLTGGGDANFFETLTRRGSKLIWCAHAVVKETISEDRATARYSIFRFIKQGNNFRRVMFVDASLTRGPCAGISTMETRVKHFVHRRQVA